MNDPSIPDPRTRKKITFYDTEKRQTDLRIRLRYEGMNQSYFFRAMITGFLNKDQNILAYLDAYKGAYQTQGMDKRATVKRMYKKGEQTKRQFKLSENEVDDIFDLIAEEHPDL